MATMTVKVKGMTCGHCTNSVEEALKALAGVNRVKADLESGEVTIDHDGQVTQELVTDSIEEIGFDVA